VSCLTPPANGEKCDLRTFGRHRGDPHLCRQRVVAASLVQSKLLARIHTPFNL
jgi:hypothetical protein